MKRRELLAALATSVVAGGAGCTALGSGNGSSDSGAPFEHPGSLDVTFATNGDYPPDENPADGFPPEFSNPRPAPNADPTSFETVDVNGETVRLAPIDTVIAWYERSEARFVDARGLEQYEHSHVYGAVSSSAQKDSTGGGIDSWPTEDRIVAYCGCPHHLSSIRTAGLQKAGHSNVFALDEGFGAWTDAGYPIGGTEIEQTTSDRISEWRLDGTVPSVDTTAYAWAIEERQYEAAPIRPDGSFTLHLEFVDVDADTPVRISTPAYTLTQPLGELAEGTISG